MNQDNIQVDKLITFLKAFGPCPLCHQGQDRFIIWPYGDRDNPNPRFYCGIHGNGCGAHGDVINFVQQLKRYQTAYEAIRDLQTMGFTVGGESAKNVS